MSRGGAERGVEEVDDSLRAVHGIVYLRMDAGHFVDGSERTGSCLAACDLGEDAVHIDAAVDHVAFAACDADIVLCGLGGEPLAGDGAAVFVGGVEELVIHGFQEADGDVAARAHECVPGLDETRGDDADGSVLQESRRGGEAAHGVTGDADLVLVDVIEVVEILRAVVKTARRHQRAGCGVLAVFVVAVTLAVHSQHDEAAAGKFDGVLQLHLTVVEIAVSEHHCGGGIFRRCGVRLEEDAADHFALDVLHLGDGLLRFAVVRSDGDGACVLGVSEVGDFHFPAVGLNAGRDHAGEEDDDETHGEEDHPLLVAGNVSHDVVFEIAHHSSLNKFFSVFTHLFRRPLWDGEKTTYFDFCAV